MKKKSVMYLVVVGLVLSIGVSYAYFTGVIKGTGNKFKVSAKEVYVEFKDTSEITEEDSIVTPGWSVTKTFTVTNESSNDFNYNIVINDLINTFVTEEYLQYKITSTNGLNMSEYKSIPKSNEEHEEVLEYDIDIEANTTQEYTIEFIYRDSEEDQSIDMGSMFGGSLGIKEGTVNPNIKYTVTLNVENGSVIGDSTKEIIKKGQVEFNVEPLEGYTLGNVVVCDNNGVGKIENGKVTVSNITNNTICTLSSEIKEYTVNISVTNGSTNEIDRKVSHGGNTEFTITPETGYTLVNAIVTGEKCSIEDGKIKITNVTSNEDTCEVTLVKEKYKVYLSGTGITTTSPKEAEYLGTTTFNITVSPGYEIENTDINCDNNAVGSREGNKVTVSNVTKETRCTIGTKELKYNVTVNVINGSGNETKEVTYGSSGEFTISANNGYNINNPSIECTGSAEKSISGNVVKISNVTGSQTCTVTLKPNEYNLQVTSNDDNYGTVSPTSGKITHGSTLEIIISPKSGYKYKSNTCGVEPVGNKITLIVSGSVTCQVVFEEDTYLVTANVTGGIASDNGSKRVTKGGSTTFKITPDTGYTLTGASVSGDGCSLTNGILTILNVIKETTCNVVLDEGYVITYNGTYCSTGEQHDQVNSGTTTAKPGETISILVNEISDSYTKRSVSNINCTGTFDTATGTSGTVPDTKERYLTITNIQSDIICSFTACSGGVWSGDV